jgi:PAS domain S-box-containing protein
MSFEYSPYILPLIVAAFISVTIAIYAWRRRSSNGALALFLMAISIFEWTFAYSLEIAGTNLETKYFWGVIQYFGIAFVPYGWFIFSISYSDLTKLLSRRFLILTGLIPLITFLLAVTTKWHGLVWSEYHVQQQGGFSAIKASYGLWFWVNAGYTYIILLAGTVLLARALWSRQGAYRGQMIAILVAVLSPWAGNALYLTGNSPIPNLDLTPFAFTVTVVALAWAIFGFHLIDITPLARDRVVDSMSDGMVILNLRDSVVDINQSAAQMIGIPVPQAIGKSAEEIFQPWQHLAAQFHAALKIQDEISVGDGDAIRSYEVRVSPLKDQQGQVTGRVVMLRSTSEEEIPQPRFAARESVTLPRDEGLRDEIPPSLGKFNVIAFFAPSIKMDIPLDPRYSPAWARTLERIFTIVLRFVAVFGLLAAILILPGINGLFEYFFSTILIISIFWALALWRTLRLSARTTIFILSLYGLAITEVFNYGYSVEAFIYFISIVVIGVLFEELRGGLTTLFVSLIIMAVFGVLIAQGIYHPAGVTGANVTPATLDGAFVSMIAFTAAAAVLVASMTVLLRSLNRAWQAELQTLNLLQQEHELLEQRVQERTRDLADARDQAVIISRQMKKYYRAMEQSGSTIVITDLNGNIEYANPRFEQSTGYTLAEAIGKTPRILKTDNQSKEYYAQLWKSISEGRVWKGEFLNKRKDGTLYWESATIAPVMDSDGAVANYVAIKDDITARRQAEEQLRKLSQAVRQSGSAVLIMDKDGKIEYANPKFIEMSGLSLAESLGKTPGNLLRDENSKIDFHEEDWWKHVTQGEVWRGEFHNIRKDGSAFWVFTTIAPVYDHKGSISNFVEIGQDITEQKLLQESLSLARDQALASSRLKSHLLARVSHELRTPLGSVLGYAELIQDDVYGAITAEQKKAMGQIIESANYLTGIVNDLLDAAQIETRSLSLNMGFFSPEILLRQVKDRMLILAQNKKLAFDAELVAPFPDKLYGDEKRIQQVLVNLANNSIKFTKNGSVGVRLYQPTPDQWCMQVTDTGVGIPEEAQQDIFTPFHQINDKITHDNRGTGLGLSIVKQIVEIMGGFIELKSEINQGSIFTVTLPITRPQEAAL